ncbi:MAG TPA: TPM domain-containing protein [Vicinamibacterales bacterium]|jgi:uncharacterized protein
MTRRIRGLAAVLTCGILILAAAAVHLHAAAEPSIPELTQPVNDFAHVIDQASATEMDRQIRALQAATGDVVVVATIPSFAPYGDITEYAVHMFENHGRGLGAKGKDNGVLVLLSMKERQVRMEVGYGLEPYVTDGFAGETSRLYMVPAFRQGDYGKGLLAGTSRVIAHIAQARHVTLGGVRAPAEPAPQDDSGMPFWVIILIIFVLIALSRRGGGGSNRWNGGGWSGWSSGVGMFGGGLLGGGFGRRGGFGGGGFGGGFGGFGGGASGGGGGGAGW